MGKSHQERRHAPQNRRTRNEARYFVGLDGASLFSGFIIDHPRKVSTAVLRRLTSTACFIFDPKVEGSSPFEINVCSKVSYSRLTST